ncbi:MAG: ANTAR domain-containing protein [Endomicrobium sp.]|jgi:response regulator NasT|nr:ANTAR domain-containing protein [Endomicrobium sp.]
MDRYKIIIAAQNKILTSVKNLLTTSLYEVFDAASSGNEAFRKASAVFPDLLIADYSLSDMTGIDLAKMAEDSRLCPVIVLANQAQSEYVDDLKGNSLDIFCVTKPLNAQVLNHTISLVLKLTHRIQEYEEQVSELKHQIEDRKLIEKAKGILMNKFNMSEDDAYKEMRKKAMNASKSLGQIAKTIIDMFEVFK